MITRKELLKSKEFWLAKFQVTLYEQVEKYLKTNNMSQTEFAAKLGVSKGYISQILNGDFDHKISKFIELSLIIEKAPLLRLEDIDKCILLDSLGMFDAIQGNAVRINLSIKYSNSFIVDKSENLQQGHTMNKKLSSRFSPNDLENLIPSSPLMALA